MMKLNRSQKLVIGAALVFFSLISSVVAATVTINTNNRVEFGQGLYRVAACDSFISVSAESNGTNMTQVIIDGFDIRNCPDTYIRLKFFGSGSAPLNLYSDSGVAVSRILLYSNGNSDLFQGLDFLNARGLIPSPYTSCTDFLLTYCKSDGFLSLDYFNGRYRLIFETPMAPVGLIESFTVETTRERPVEVIACNTVLLVGTVAESGMLKEVTLDGLDIKNCPGKYTRVRFFEGASTSPLPLYRESGIDVNRILVRATTATNPDLLTGLDIVNGFGLIPSSYTDCSTGLRPYCRTDGYISVDYYQGRYSFVFETPLVTMARADSYTVTTSDGLPGD